MNPQPIPTAPQLFGKKLTLSIGLIGISIAYGMWQRFGTTAATSVAPSAITTAPSQAYKDANAAILQTISQLAESGSNPPPTAQPSPAKTVPVTTTPAYTPAPAPAPKKPAGQYTDGSYTGTAADAYYGTVQVKAVIQGGRLADVQFIQHPSDRSTSVYINDQAMPLLTQEAIQAQSAQVDGVSGATFTSQAFEQSLASALTQAKI